MRPKGFSLVIIFLFILSLIPIHAFSCFKNLLKLNVEFIQKDTTEIKSTTKALTYIDSSAIVLFTNEFRKFSPLKKELINFYRSRNGEPYWMSQLKLNQNGKILLGKIDHLEEEGLIGHFNDNPKIMKLLSDCSDKQICSINTEIIITCRYLQYASYVWIGMDPSNISQLKWNIPSKKISFSELLNALNKKNDWYTNQPLIKEYQKLLAYLLQYENIQRKGTLFQFEQLPKGNIRVGEQHEVIIKVRKFLLAFGYIPSNNGSAIFDSILRNGLHEFQLRNGLPETDVITKTEINEMAIPVKSRIDQIKVNLERIRWLPIYDSEEKLVINIPEFNLHVYGIDSIMFNMKVITGKTFQPTAVFHGDLEEIILCPYWNIPPGILKNEILPALNKNNNYLKQNNMEWNGKGIRQRPGYDNALGWIKFLFPNRYNIYMHDTPNKYLFEKNIRTFSHGCIRLENAKKLAVYLLRNQKEWKQNAIDSIIQKQKEKIIKLPKKIPVYIVYRTAWVDEKGKLNFRKDIYKKDGLLLQYLNQKKIPFNY